MAIGVIGSSGKQNAYKDFNVTISAQTGGVDNWAADATVGATAYTQTVLAEDISPNLYIDGATDFYIIPNPNAIISI